MNERRTGRRILFTVFAAAAGLLSIELLAHAVLAAVSPEDQTRAGQGATGGGDGGILMQGDPHLLWRLAPGEREEHGNRVSINAAGLRGRDRGPSDGPRLLALGDSSVYGFGVSDAAVFTARLEGMLDGVEVINGGVPGYSTEQALNLLSLGGLALEPDVLLVATLWSDNNFDHFVDAERLGTYRHSQGQPSVRFAALLRLTATGRLLGMALGGGEDAQTVGWMQDSDRGGGRRRVPLRDYAENLARFCTLMAEREGGVVFVVLPNTEDLSVPRGVPPWGPYRDAMARTAEACGAPLVSMPDAFAGSGKPSGQLFLDEMHPSLSGHAVMAQAIADTLALQGWPAKPLRVRDPGGPVAVDADPFEGRGEELGLVGGRSGRAPSDGPPGPPGPPGSPP